MMTPKSALNLGICYIAIFLFFFFLIGQQKILKINFIKNKKKRSKTSFQTLNLPISLSFIDYAIFFFPTGIRQIFSNSSLEKSLATLTTAK